MQHSKNETAELSRPGNRSVWRRQAVYVFAYVIALAAALPYLIPPLPRTKLGWLLLLVLGPPLYLVGEWLGEKVVGNWGERTLARKLLKAALLILLCLAALILQGIVSAG